MQWGSFSVTNNPNPTWGDDYTPAQQTVAEWGNSAWTPYGTFTEIIEYPQWSDEQEQYWTYLTKDQVEPMVDENAFTTGLSSFFNWQNFLIPYYQELSVELGVYETAWGMDSTAMDTFVDNLRGMVESRFFTDGFATISVEDMMNGFTNPYADIVGKGNYTLGDYYAIFNYTTPIRNSVESGPMNNVNYGMLTGSNGVDEIGQIRIINEEAFANKVVQMYNSTAYLNITQSDPKLPFDQQGLADVTGGMQFPPLMDSSSQLRVFDPRTVKIATYRHENSMTLGNDEQLNVEKFVGTSFGDDISFGFNLPLYEKPYGCYQCNLNADEQRKIYVNGDEWTEATEDSDNYMIVQPDSGYTYEISKNSSIYMIVGGNQTFAPYHAKPTPFPSLDPIYGLAIPLYDYSSLLRANQDTYKEKFEYIADAQNTMRATVIAMSVFAAFFLLLGIVTITIYKMGDPKRKNSQDENLVNSQDLID